MAIVPDGEGRSGIGDFSKAWSAMIKRWSVSVAALDNLRVVEAWHRSPRIGEEVHDLTETGSVLKTDLFLARADVHFLV